MKMRSFIGLLLASFIHCAYAAGFADRLYVIDCGEGHADDESLWTPGANQGKAVDFSDNCYLIRHGKDWLLWDTGVADATADHPDGVRVPQNKTTWTRKQKLASSLAALGLAPQDIGRVALSHSHPDHSGNIELFPAATLLVQSAEYDWPAPGGGPRFLPGHPAQKLSGDYDVFGDSSVMIVATPGHTPGHQSLLVRLKATGAVVLSGDAVHLRENWEQRRIPAINVDAAHSRDSVDKLASLLAQEHAQLWINHDAPQSARQRHAPGYYD